MSHATRRGRLLDIALPMTVIFRQRVPFWQFLVRAISRRYRLSAFGFLWTIFVPLFTLGIYTFVFGVVMQNRWGAGGVALGTASYGVNLFAGLIVFWLMADVMTQAPGSIVEHANLVKKSVFPLDIIPPVVVGSAVFHTLINTAVLLVAMMALEGRIPNTALLFPAVLLPFILLLTGISWLLAAIGVYFRDIVHMIGLILTGILFLSPVFYPLSRLSPTLQNVIALNPIAFVVVQARLVLLEGQQPDWQGLLYQLIVAWVVAAVGLAFFQHARKNFADVL